MGSLVIGVYYMKFQNMELYPMYVCMYTYTHGILSGIVK